MLRRGDASGGSAREGAAAGATPGVPAKTISRNARGTWKLRFPVGDQARNWASFPGAVSPPGRSMRKTLKRQTSPALGGRAVPGGAFDVSAAHGSRETAVQPLVRPAASILGWTRLSRPFAF